MFDFVFSPVKAIVGALVLAVAAYGIHTYNGWIGARATAKMDADYAIKFNDIAGQAQKLKATIEANDAAARLTIAKTIAEQQEKANDATRKYKAELARNKELMADRNRAMASSSDLLGRMLNTSTASVGSRPECPSLSRYTDQLSERYASCERDLAEAVSEAAKAIDRASAAEAAVRALAK
jgi:hypothetical protein